MKEEIYMWNIHLHDYLKQDSFKSLKNKIVISASFYKIKSRLKHKML